MDSKFYSLVVFAALVGCGTTMKNAGKPTGFLFPTPPPSAAANANSAPAAASEAIAPTTVAPTPTPDWSALPESPWSSTQLRTSDVPDVMSTAWKSAENHDRCPLIAPQDSTLLRGARPRNNSVEGSWSVEFDRAGLPGFDRAGNTCEHCGHGVMGIAGTSLSSDPTSQGQDAASLSPTFRDGSRVEYEPANPQRVSVANISLGNHDCVYQVWSYLGKEHLDQLVQSLRIVSDNSAQ